MTSLNIKRLAKRRGWSLTELAERCQIPRPTLSAYNSGRRNPSLKQLLRIARALGCQLRDLLPANLPVSPLTDDEWQAVHWFRTLTPAAKIRALERANQATESVRRLRGRQ